MLLWDESLLTLPSSASCIAELLKIEIHISFPHFFSQSRSGSITCVQTAKPICLTVILVYINHCLLVLKCDFSIQLYTQCSFLSLYAFFVIRHRIKLIATFILILPWKLPTFPRSELYIKNHLVPLLVVGFSQLMTFQIHLKNKQNFRFYLHST